MSAISSSAYQTQEPFLGAEGFGIPLKFANASDYLVARLFLVDGQDIKIPWEFCEAIISTIRDPRFDARNVTFKDYGDMLCRIGKCRDEAWSLVEARAQGTTTIPRVVLDGVFDVLRFELENPESRWFTDDSGVRSLLKNMSLVHSSWHGIARRLLGTIVSSLPMHAELKPDILQAPSIGPWTRTLSLTHYLRDEEDKAAIVSKQLHILRHLCSRITGVRVLNLQLRNYTKSCSLSASSMNALYNSLSALTRVEELTLSDPHITSSMVRLISEAHHKTLRSLHFHIDAWKDLCDKSKFPESFSSLTSLPNLRSIHADVSVTDPRGALPAISDITWLRGASELKSLIPSKISIFCLSEEKPTRFKGRNVAETSGVREMLQSANLIDFFVWRCATSASRYNSPPTLPSEEEIAIAVAHVLKWSTSVHKLVFRGFPWSHVKMFGMLDVPSSVRELLVVSSPPLPSSDDDFEKILEICAFPSYDKQLAQALGAGLAPSLQVLQVRFTEIIPSYRVRYRSARRTFDYCARYYAEAVLGKATAEELNGPDVYEHLLPQCRQKCFERGIAFEVDVDC